MNMNQTIRTLLTIAASIVLPAAIASAQGQLTVTSSAAAGGGAAVKGGTYTVTQGGGGGRTAVAAGRGGQSNSVTVITNKDDDTNHTVEVRIENGQMTIKCDGKEVPEAQIKHEDGQIIILDENGKEIQKVGVGVFGHDMTGLHGFTGWASADPYNKALAGATLFGQGEEANPPKVMLGIHMTEPGPALGKHLHIDTEKCLMISGVFKGLPADQAGIEQYDIIVKVDGESPADRDALRKVLDERQDGDSVTLSIIHEGKNKDVKIKLAKFDPEALASAELIGDTGDNIILKAFKSSDPLAPQGVWNRLYTAEGKSFSLPQMGEAQARLLEKLNTTGNSDERLDSLNQRLAELERLLQELVQQKNSRNP